MMPVKRDPTVPGSQVKQSTTEPLRSFSAVAIVRKNFPYIGIGLLKL